ncbi:MAG: ATP-binding cassette domain-containing protein [Rickettsiales bacterium]|jgi:Fe-S cluster assembly ATP-binding protein|nr:ATP-binding cassette domain-containing protein [Rickettsiales bacterium]
MSNILEIQNLTVNLGDRKLLDGINLSVGAGARHLLSGHNGSGKSTLAQTIAGNPDYTIGGGRIIFDGRNVTDENATTRALLGIFLGAQNVPEIPGLTVMSFLKHSAAAHRHFQTGKDLSMGEFLADLETARARLDIPKEWLNRGVNVGFSGGERKRLMLLRLLMTPPKLAILDEPDSGADASVQKMIADIMNEMQGTTFLFISHQENFTRLVCPSQTTTLSSGKIVI